VGRPNSIEQFKFEFNGESKKKSDDEWQACNSLRQLCHDIAEGIKQCNGLSNIFSGQPVKLIQMCGFDVTKTRTGEDLDICTNQLNQISTYGSFLKRRAAYWAAEHVATSPRSTRLRIEMANFAQFAAEYGNQITSRSDALLKQSSGAKGLAIAREQLPNSIYLRDSEPTAYLNLYDWNEAAVSSGEERGRRTTPAERIRMVEHLVADNYWSHINTVFAAGQGDVSMALVKDDVGNWNLKSFDNDPSDLLDAYKKVGLAAVGAITELASDASGLPSAEKALNFANQIALGSTSGARANETEERLAGLRRETARLIQEIGREQEQRKSALEESITEIDAQIAGNGDSNSGLKGKYETATGKLKTKTESITTLQSKIAARKGSVDALDAKIATLAEQRDVAVGRRSALLSSNDDNPPGAEGNAAPPRATPADVTAIDVQIGDLDDRITAETVALSKQLKWQSMDLEMLKQERVQQADLERAADEARKTLDAALAKRSALESRKSDLVDATAARIQQLLDLHGAVVARMAIAVAEAAGTQLPSVTGREDGYESQN
ncbi:MAG: hypothetical protein OXH38_02120, partial [Chloroflexi bacterium]|nr:hypothetical protein [Chloroflexota bacterium]